MACWAQSWSGECYAAHANAERGGDAAADASQMPKMSGLLSYAPLPHALTSSRAFMTLGLCSIAALSPSRQAYVTLAAEGDLAGSLDVGQVQGLVGGSGPAAPCSAVASAARHSSTRSSPNTWLHPISSHGSLASESLQVFRHGPASLLLLLA